MTDQYQKQSTAQKRQHGFALPLVLVAIASLAIITLVGYRAVAGAAAIVMAIQDDARVEQAFFSAEAEAAFTFLSSPAVEGGIATGDGAIIANESPIGEAGVSGLGERQYWSANGERRISAYGSSATTVSYFDAAGFAPIDLMSEEDLTLLLSAAGFSGNDAELMAARIADFQDHGAQRRFRGAERADYRLFGIAAPTDSPLRKPGELAAVLGYADLAPPSSWDFMLDNVRFGGLFSQFKPRLGPEILASLFVDAGDSPIASDPLESYGIQDVQPTETARFLLSHQADGRLTRRRAVEIMRTANAADKPFRRVWNYDKVNDDNGAATTASERRDMAPVYQPAAVADPR